MTPEQMVAVILGDHDHDVASFNYRCPDGDFTLEFADFGTGPIWNVANSPPRMPPDPFTIVKKGSRFAVIESSALTAEEAIRERDMIASHIGDGQESCIGSRTFSTRPAPQLMTAVRKFLGGLPLP